MKLRREDSALVCLLNIFLDIQTGESCFIGIILYLVEYRANFIFHVDYLQSGFEI